MTQASPSHSHDAPITTEDEILLAQHNPWSLTGVPLETSESGIYVQHSGPWFLNARGEFAWGSLGMLVDHGLGGVLFAGRPPGLNGMVTTELSIDFNPEVELADGEFHLATHTVGTSQAGGLSTGEITNETGNVVATTSLSGRYLPIPEGGYLELPQAPDSAVPFASILPMTFEPLSEGVIGTLPMTRLNLDNSLHQCKETPYAFSLAVADHNGHVFLSARLARGGSGLHLAGWWVFCPYRGLFLKWIHPIATPVAV